MKAPWSTTQNQETKQPFVHKYTGAAERVQGRGEEVAHLGTSIHRNHLASFPPPVYVGPLAGWFKPTRGSVRGGSRPPAVQKGTPGGTSPPVAQKNVYRQIKAKVDTDGSKKTKPVSSTHDQTNLNHGDQPHDQVLPHQQATGETPEG